MILSVVVTDGKTVIHEYDEKNICHRITLKSKEQETFGSWVPSCQVARLDVFAASINNNSLPRLFKIEEIL